MSTVVAIRRLKVKFSTRGRWPVTLTPRCFTLDSSWLFREDKDLSTLPGMEPRVLGLPTRVLVTANTELLRLASVNIFHARTAREGTSTTLQELRIGIITLKTGARCKINYWHICEGAKTSTAFWRTQFCLFSVALRPNAGHGLLILEVSWSHTTTHHSRLRGSPDSIWDTKDPS